MSDPGLSRVLAAGAALLLRPPDATTLAALAESSGVNLDPGQARQDFYDVLCVPQSGRYVPPYAHVLSRGRMRNVDWWHFPPPRFDGGDSLAPWYDAVGFDPTQLDVDPLLKGPHRPLDHAGFILASLAGLAASGETGQTDRTTADPIIAAFVAAHVGSWLERFCTLLYASGSPYLAAVAEAIEEAASSARSRYLPAESNAAAVAHRPAYLGDRGTDEHAIER